MIMKAVALKTLQTKFQNSQIKRDLQNIRDSYFRLMEGLEKWSNPSMSLMESMRILNTVSELLFAVEIAKNFVLFKAF